MRIKSLLVILLIIGISVAVVSAALIISRTTSKKSVAQAEGEATGMLMPLRIPVIFVDANGDGNVESLKDAISGETIYTFPSPIVKPQTGILELTGPQRPGTRVIVD